MNNYRCDILLNLQDFDQQFEWAAPKRWLIYTTLNLFLFYFCIWKNVYIIDRKHKRRQKPSRLMRTSSGWKGSRQVFEAVKASKKSWKDFKRSFSVPMTWPILLFKLRSEECPSLNLSRVLTPSLPEKICYESAFWVAQYYWFLAD